jgi:hypothetical protein
MVRLQQGVHFADGIYANFSEWKNNSPHISQFQIIKTNTFGSGDEIEIRYNCKGDNGSSQNCEVKNCFGYVLNGSFYISQGFYSHFFRVFIVGSLTHFIAYSGFDDPNAYFTSEPNGLIGASNDLREYVIDFSDGSSFEFTYKNFASFLKERDPQLYQELLTSKNRRKMIHHFLLKYNERHPIYIPVAQAQ